MFRKPEKPNELDRRVRDLDEELRRLRKTIKALESGKARPEPPAAAPVRPRPPPFSAPPPPAAPVAPAAPAPVAPAGPGTSQAPMTMQPNAPVGGQDDFFARGTRAPSGPPQAPASWRSARPSGTYPGAEHDPALEDKRRFASYFSSGSFASTKPLRQERRFQRNRAVVMIVVVIVFAYVLFSILYH